MSAVPALIEGGGAPHWTGELPGADEFVRRCDRFGLGVEPMLRLALAISLAEEGSAISVSLLSASDTTRGHASVASIDLDPEEEIAAAARRWRTTGVTLGDPPALAQLRELRAALTLPAFALDPAAAEFGFHTECPLRAVISSVDGGLAMELASPSGERGAAALAALADNLAAAVSAFVDSPEETLGVVARCLPVRRFDVNLVANGGHERLVPFVRHWGEEIGLPVSVRALQLGELDATDTSRAPLSGTACGAAVLLTNPDEWERRSAPAPADPSPDPSRGGDRYRLANGRVVAQWSSAETRQLDDEIFGRRSYLRHGLRIADRAIVVDVGANVGAFALFAHLEAAGVEIHAVEPVAELAALARENARLHGIDATVHEVALGDRNSVTELDFYPEASLQSGLFADPGADLEVSRRYVANQLRGRPNGHGRDAHVGQETSPLLGERLRSEHRTVTQRRLSDLIEEAGLMRIDLLKVDVERGEEAVLDGIDFEHWPRIGQVAVEVHDRDGRLDRLIRMLEGHGFSVAVEQEALFSGTEVYMLYASRDDPGADPGNDAHKAIAAAAETWGRLAPVPVYLTVLPAPSGLPRQEAIIALRAAVSSSPNVRFLDLTEALPADLEPSAEAGAAAAATEIVRRVTAPLRPPLKALVVDADGTLWNGVCGEAGPDGVSIGPARLAFQRQLLEQRERGRLLCLCSRNELSDVEAVFARNPEMPLQLSDFAAARVNWEAKADNLLSLAEELEIMPESIVFLDDDPAQRDEIRLRVPGATVVELPADAAGYASCLAATWSLDPPLELTEEDRLRAGFVANEKERARVAATATGFAQYLAQLDLRVETADAGEEDVARIVQLAQRTNQFNLTLRRHGEVEARHLLADSELALTARVADRFGDYGLVGFVAAAEQGEGLEVTDFMLSCRALGRNVEWAMLCAAAARAGDRELSLAAVKGQRNAPVHTFLEQVRDRCAATGAEGECRAPAPRLLELEWREIEPRRDPAPLAKAAGTGGGGRYRWPAPASGSLAGMLRTAHFPKRHARRARTTYAKPGSDSERRVAGAWSEVLGIGGIGVHDDFFLLGGDSLAALAVCDLLERNGQALTLEDFLADPTIAAIATRLDLAKGSFARADARGGIRCEEASDGQRRVWSADVSGPAGAQTIPLAYEVSGELDGDRLEAALAAAVARHRSLHTVLVPEGDRLLRRKTTAPLKLERTDLRGLVPDEQEHELARLRRQFFTRPFDLEREPALRCLLLGLGPARHMLLLAAHHSTCDGWSVGILQRDIGECFGSYARHIAAADASFGDYVAWVRERERRGDYEGGLESLRRELPALESAPRMRADRAGGRGDADCRRVEVCPPLVADVRAEARSRGTTPFAIHLGAFALTLAAHNGRSSAWLGCPFANRGGPGHRGVVGFLANIVPVGLTVDWGTSAGAYLDACATAARGALLRADVPYGLLLRDRFEDPYRFEPAPFEALFTLQTPPSHPLRLADCRVAAVDPIVWPLPYELMLDIQEQTGGATALLRCDRSRFEPATARAFVEGYAVALEALTRVESLPLIAVKAMLADLAAKIAEEEMDTAAALRGERLRGLRGVASTLGVER